MRKTIVLAAVAALFAAPVMAADLDLDFNSNSSAAVGNIQSFSVEGKGGNNFGAEMGTWGGAAAGAASGGSFGGGIGHLSAGAEGGSWSMAGGMGNTSADMGFHSNGHIQGYEADGLSGWNASTSSGFDGDFTW